MSEDYGSFEVHSIEIEHLKKELDEIKLTISALHQLTVQIERIALEIKHTREDFNILAKRVAAIESRPIKRYEAVSMSITTAIIGAVVGAIAVALGYK